MPVVAVNARNLPQVLRQHFVDRVESLRRASVEVAHRGQAEAVAIANREGLVHLGAYKRGFRVVPRPSGAELRNDAPHAMTIEWGRRPRRPGPPIEPIREWVRLKLGKSGRELEAAAWAIRHHIHEKGSPPKFIMKRVYQQMRGWYRDEVERRLRTGS